MSDCVFCRRIERGEVEREFRAAVSFAPLHPVTEGHLLVVSRKHIRDAAQDPTTSGQVMYVAAGLAQQLGDCNIITSVGEAATQTVFHLHVHLVPRRPGDGLRLPWGH